VNPDLEWIQNIDLLHDNLRHLRLELCMDRPFWFRVGKEAYQALCRAMVEALRGSANRAITSSRRSTNRRVYYHLGDMTWKMIEKCDVPTCRLAWRFSDPVPQKPPNDLSGSKEASDDHLVGFFDLLAMIQTECFMSRMAEARPVVVSDADMRTLEWLHDSIRNEFEHFMPKLYGADLGDLKRGAKIGVALSLRLFTQSGNIWLVNQHAALLPALETAETLLESVGVRRESDPG
jgi:hypothetical protein